MATEDNVRRIALALPEAVQDPKDLRFLVRGKAFAWSWKERVDPKKTRVPRYDILAVRVADEWEKQGLIDSNPDTFFTEPHYDGYPAVLVRLPVVESDQLAELLTNAWRIQAPKELVRELDAG